MGEVKKNILNQALLNPITVYSGGVPVAGYAGDDLADAVAAAGALASATNPVVVSVGPGAAGTIETDDLPEFVSIKYEPVEHAKQVGVPRRTVERFNTPLDMPMVALRFDDWASQMTAVPTGSPLGANISPVLYMMHRGVPFTVGVNETPLLAANASYATINQLRVAFAAGGAELASHSADHALADASLAELLNETIGSKKAIEALRQPTMAAMGGYSPSLFKTSGLDTAMDYPNQIGAICRGWIKPGSGGFQANVDVSSLGHKQWQLLGANFDWASGDNLTQYTWFAPAEASGLQMAYKNQADSATPVSMFAAGPEGAGCGVQLLTHFYTADVAAYNYGGTTGWASWKAFIDDLVTARNKGQLALVNMSTLVNANRAFPPSDGSRLRWGGVPLGTFETVSALPTSGPITGTGTVTEDGGNNFVRCVNGNSLNLWLSLRPGTYLLRFRIAAENASVTPIFRWGYSESGDFKGLRIDCPNLDMTRIPAALPTEDYPSSDFPYYMSFGIPVWCQQFRIQFYVADSGGTAQVDFDNFECIRLS